jgi:hypothetical protein
VWSRSSSTDIRIPDPAEVSLAFQPMVSTIDAENIIHLARGAEYVGDPTDINEAEKVAWFDLGDVASMIERGDAGWVRSIPA